MENILHLSYFGAAMLNALFILPVIIILSNGKNLVEPTNERKKHAERVSSLGGIGIFLAAALCILALGFPIKNSPVMALSLALPLLVVGLWDDLHGASISLRIVVQVLVGVLLFDLGYQVSGLGHWLLDLGATVLLVMLLINAYNFMDGINGLAGSLGLAGSFLFGGLLLGFGEAEMAGACFAYAGALAGFLVYNFGKKAKIFMGDNGSTVLGFLMAVMVLSAFQAGRAEVAAAPVWPIVAIIVGLPVFDLLKVTAQRIARLQSPFSADRTHIHHLFVDGQFSHPATCAILVGWVAAFGCLALLLPYFFSFANMVAFLAGPYCAVAGLRFFHRKLTTAEA